MSSFMNPFRRARHENESGQIHLTVKWGAHKFNIPIPAPSTTPLSQLIATLSSSTQIPPDQMKLVFRGAVLKDMSLTLTSYGIGDGAQLTMVGKTGPAPAAPAPAPKQQVVKKKNKQPETNDERVLTEWIHNLVKDTVDPLAASVATFVSQTSKDATNRPKHIPPFETLQMEHARLSELLLRVLLDLDNVEIPSEWTHARAERKAGVKAVQERLTKVDDAWGDRKKLGSL